MNLYVANTDYDWYQFLLFQESLDEVNFWKPSGQGSFKALRQYEPLVFKLKKAHGHRIVGFGFFVVFRRLDLHEAWISFGPANGAASLEEMWTRVSRYVQGYSQFTPIQYRHQVGCIMLAGPVFFPPGLEVDAPVDWKDQIVAGKGYDSTRGEGRRIWQDCLNRAAALAPPLAADVNRLPEAERYGNPLPVRQRLGQGTFRYAVEQAYDGTCAVTTEHSLPALEAAHIKPFSQGGPHAINNGLLLRADVHRLFDKGYVTITPDYRFRVSPRLDRDFQNGRVYYALQDRRIITPRDPELQPDRERLEWHSDTIFLAR